MSVGFPFHRPLPESVWLLVLISTLRFFSSGASFKRHPYHSCSGSVPRATTMKSLFRAAGARPEDEGSDASLIATSTGHYDEDAGFVLVDANGRITDNHSAETDLAKGKEVASESDRGELAESTASMALSGTESTVTTATSCDGPIIESKTRRAGFGSGLGPAISLQPNPFEEFIMNGGQLKFLGQKSTGKGNGPTQHEASANPGSHQENHGSQQSAVEGALKDKEAPVRRRDTKFRVAIVGASIAGLLLAHALRFRPDIAVVVFEKQPDMEAWLNSITGDWSVPAPDAAEILEPMRRMLPADVFAAVEEALSVDTALYEKECPFTDPVTPAGGSGRPMYCSLFDRLANFRGLRLKKVLAQDIHIAWDKNVWGVNTHGHLIRAYFKPRDPALSVSADLLVGADGELSTVRTLAFQYENMPQGSRPTFHPLVELVAHLPDFVVPEEHMPPERQAMRCDELGVCTLTQHYWEPEDAVRIDGTLRLSRLINERTPVEDNRAPCWVRNDLSKFFSSISSRHIEPWKSCLDYIENPQAPAWFQARNVDSWFGKSWNTHNGRVVLVGGATHHLLPFGSPALIEVVRGTESLSEAIQNIPDPQSDNDEVYRFEKKRLLEEYHAEMDARVLPVCLQQGEEARVCLNEAWKRQFVQQGYPGVHRILRSYW